MKRCAILTGVHRVLSDPAGVMRPALWAAVVLSVCATAQPTTRRQDRLKDGSRKERLGTEAPSSAAAEERDGQEELDITADTVEMNFEERKAVFQGNVQVNEARSILTADKMIVYLTDEDDLRYIEAIGNVVIREIGSKRVATSGRAEFDVEKDTIVLLDGPALSEGERGQVSQAEKITYYRSEQRFVFTGRPRMRIKVKRSGKGMTGGLLGRGLDKRKEDASRDGKAEQ